MNTTRRPTTLKLLVGVLIATCALTATANAQSSFVGRFTLPYEVHWGRAVLPAGGYSISIDSLHTPAILRPASGKQFIYPGLPFTDNSEKGGAFLVITVLGHERRVRSLNLPALGASLVYQPLTKTEREMIAKAGLTESIPIVMSKK